MYIPTVLHICCAVLSRGTYLNSWVLALQMNGQTVLHKAASVREEGCVEVIKMLMKGGADLNIQDIVSTHR